MILLRRLKTEITNSEFKYNKAAAGGAISSYAKFIDINGTDFTFNEANYGSAIFADRTSYAISNSTFLNNSADSVELTLNVDDSEYTATAIYRVNNTLLNAIYRVEGSILLENVTYWGENGVSNSDDGYIEDVYAINQNVTLIVKDNANIEIYNSDFKNICSMQDAIIEEINQNIMVYNEKQVLYFSKEGKQLTNIEVYGQNQIFAKQNNGYWGFVDFNGNTVVDFKYNKVTEVNEYGFAGICLNGKWGVIDSQGKILLEPTYELKNKPTFIGNYYKVTYGFGEVYYTK